MPASLDCPEIERWQALYAVGFAPDQREECERHLESCTICQERLDQAEKCGAELRKLCRQFGDPTAAPPDPTLAEVLERLHEVKSPVRTNPAEPADLYFLRPTDRPELLGMLGEYEVQEVIGQGGMGVVLKAFEPALHRLVAIKVMAAAVAGSASARRRFTREAQAAAAVCHEHVVTVYGVNEVDGLPYLVMQYIAGESLQERLDRTGPLEVKEVVRIAYQTAAGLAAAHAQGLIHRDIKPANLLLQNLNHRDTEAQRRQQERTAEEDSSSSSPLCVSVPLWFPSCVKITDFGLARMVDDIGLTQNGVVAGTPEYMAPEQARGEPVDHRADLFSLGSVLYALCTGVPPFRGSSAVAVLRRVSEEEPEPVRERNPDMPVWLEALIARLLAKEPANRLQSAAEVAVLLEGYLAHLRQPATVPTPELPPASGNEPGSLPGFAGRSRSRLGLGALVSLAVLGLGLAQWFAGAGDGVEPAKEHKGRYALSLRGTPENAEGFEFFGPDVEQCVRYERAGLRFTLPRGYAGQRPGTGLTIPVAVKGDFEITVSFEILQEPEPADAGAPQTLFSVDAVLAAPGKTVATIARKVDARNGPQFLAWMTRWDEAAQKEQTRGKGFPTTLKSGQLRMVRTGSTLAYYASAAPDSEFAFLEKFPFAADDLQAVFLIGSTGGPRAALDVRATDLCIRSDSLPELPETTVVTPEKPRGRGWLAAGALLALVLLLAAVIPLGAWLHGRRRRRASQAPARASASDGRAEPEAMASSISFPCPACRKNLRAKAELAGKKTKCPKCGASVFVPGIKTARSGSTP